MKKSTKSRALSRRRETNRRNFLRIERLEDRMVLTGVAPIAVNDLYHTLPDQPLDISAPGILANDTDAEGDALTAQLFSGPAHGSLSLAADGSFQYTPDSGFNGIDSFMYVAIDGTSCSLLAAVTLKVGEGGPPTAEDDSFTVNEDEILTLPAPASVLHNDSDPDGDALSASLVTGPANGSVALAADGSFVYTPAANFHGTDSFVYQASDGANASNEATVTITVNSINDKPVASNDAFSVDEDNPLVVPASDVMGNDSDADGDPLAASLVSGPVHGTLSLAADGSFSYTPSENFNGVDGFSYLVSDGSTTSNVATVTIEVNSVNDGPIAVGDEYTTAEDTPLSIDAAAGLLGNDSDVDGDSLAAALVNGPAHGTLTLNSDGSFLYTPEANFNGVDSFSYTVNDGTADSGVANVILNVTAVNDGPLAANDEYTIDEDSSLTLAAPGILENDSDPEGDPLAASLVSGPLHGTLQLNADGSLTYTPESNYSGVDGFSYLVSDGAAESEVATVTVNVNAVADAPIATNDEYTTDEDSPLSIDAAAGLLANDTDIDSSSLTATLVSGPVNGTLAVNADGSFTYTPSADFSGVDGFSYSVSDGTLESAVATVTINVSAVADAPVAQDDAFATDEDTPLVVDAAGGILTNDSDVDGDALTAALITGPAHGTLTLSADGSFSYAPEANFSGTDSFTYKAGDGSLESGEAIVTITVNPINDSPVAAGDEYTTDEDTPLVIDAAAGTLANDSDADGDALTATLVSGPSSGTLTFNADGSFSYTPAADFNGSDSFVYKASDGQAETADTTVTITVQAVNDAPTAEGDSYVTDEDSPLVIDAPGVLANDNDIDGDALSAAIATGPAHGTVALNSDGSFTYTPEANFNGSDLFTYKASDGSLESGETTVAITVTAVADAPLAHGDAYSVGEDNTLNAPVELGVLANDFDPQDLPLTAELVSGPTSGALTLNADGSFSYAPAANFHGTDSFTYVANNGNESSEVMTATIVVEPLNDAPVAVNDDYATAADGTISADALAGVIANDTDIDGDSLSATLLWGPSHGTLTLNSDGSFTYAAASGFTRDDSFKYQLSDGMANSNVATVALHVGQISPNEAPVSKDDWYAAQSDSTLTIAAPGVLENDTDAEGDALSVTLVAGPAHGALTLNGDGSFSYTPESGFAGDDSFTYKANDGTSDGNEVTVVLSVADPNQDPAALDDSYLATADTLLSVPASEGVLANDSDPDGDLLTTTLVSGTAHGTLTLNADGSFDYQPEIGFTGVDSFTYQVSDGTGVGGVATATVTVAAALNSRPLAVNDTFTTTVNQPLEASGPGVMGNDGDPEGNTLSVELFSGPQHGSLTLNSDGSFLYTPEADFQGRDSFMYRTFDGDAYSALAAVTIYVNPSPAGSGEGNLAASVAEGECDSGGRLGRLVAAAIRGVAREFSPREGWLSDDLLDSLASASTSGRRQDVDSLLTDDRWLL